MVKERERDKGSANALHSPIRGRDNENRLASVRVVERNAKLYLSEGIAMDKWCWFKVGEIQNVIVWAMFAPIYNIKKISGV